MAKIAILGGGNIGTALLRGLLEHGVCAKDICVSNRRAERSVELREAYGVAVTEDNTVAVAGAKVVFVCVKPYKITSVLSSIASALELEEDDCIIVSMAAGITISQLEEVVAAGTPLVRVMPNTPMQIGRGVSAIAAGRFCDAEQLGRVRELLSNVGTVIEVQESDMDAVTAVSGSAPAYLFLFTEAMIDAGVHLGLSRDVARQFAVSTFAGAAEMMAQTDAEPAVLRAQVTSPAGTTAAGIREFEESGMRGMVYRATAKVMQCSRELS
ncbi:MAG: pyrroline-5-carboxylate reductase [Corynebacterium sp.]|nr:pyrroline-5-carboxylate reductase [Corynebacterium sp.]